MILCRNCHRTAKKSKMQKIVTGIKKRTCPFCGSHRLLYRPNSMQINMARSKRQNSNPSNCLRWRDDRK